MSKSVFDPHIVHNIDDHIQVPLISSDRSRSYKASAVGNAFASDPVLHHTPVSNFAAPYKHFSECA